MKWASSAGKDFWSGRGVDTLMGDPGALMWAPPRMEAQLEKGGLAPALGPQESHLLRLWI
jgi:hypothetical protein